ncbi:MAG: type II toxin-antitoxin system RelE/ParE family toxin [Betaproteobacteria bacterium]|nr:type II toxin-antitoxin system RelE/ParE family toxin [Betaproteobacteria bacterium]
MSAGTSKPRRWSARALSAFELTLDHIAADDPATAEKLRARVAHSIELIQSQPGIGTSTATPGVRRYPVPNTGHVFTYRVVDAELRIMRWFRARQDKNG